MITTATAASWTMPDSVGRNLEDAQDAIQALTGNAIFFTKSHDATGRGRHQILDRDWKVCGQRETRRHHHHEHSDRLRCRQARRRLLNTGRLPTNTPLIVQTARLAEITSPARVSRTQSGRPSRQPRLC
jgi:hypothetical protein